MKALVIDDSLTTSLLLCQQLQRLGLDARVARDAAQGLALFSEDRPDLVFIDAVLAGQDAFELARSLRALEGEGEWAPIILLTATLDEERLERGIAAGCDDFLVKPVAEVVLHAKVRSMQRMTQMRYSLVVLSRRLAEANRELLRMSTEDGLTGLANRRRFDDALSREWARAVRSGQSLALLMMDVDQFKPYNDLYGHLAGDECLRRLGAVLASAGRRPADLAARYGGEEFAMILPETTEEGAALVAQDIRRRLAELSLAHAGAENGRVTLSIGVACTAPREAMGDALALVAAADRALYLAKQGGRDCVLLSAGLTV
ncbi:MAG: diguanylate cyclase [Candidatus Dactylopiibacterium sp.]|nr:diguanylate cyclase [Candidatus Dactylopiibacterium sp.]